MSRSTAGVEIACLLCHGKDVLTVYAGPVRQGGPASRESMTSTVQSCQNCGVRFLFPVPDPVSRYEPRELEDKDYAGKIASQQVWIEKIGLAAIARKTLLEVGAGSGYFLDIVRKVAGDCHAVEIHSSNRRHLSDRADFVYTSVDEVPTSSIDVAVAFDVLEHVSEPIELLKSVFRSLRTGGVFWVGVPNQNDLLLEIEPAYLPFYYHDSHLWYFSVESLVFASSAAGFFVDRVFGVHKYNLGNFLHWVATKAPNGKPLSDHLSEISTSFGAALEQTGRSSHLLVGLVRRQ